MKSVVPFVLVVAALSTQLCQGLSWQPPPPLSPSSRFGFTPSSSTTTSLFSSSTRTTEEESSIGSSQNNPPSSCHKESFSIPLVTERPPPKDLLGILNQLWNDPRPVSTLIGDAISRTTTSDTDEGKKNDGRTASTIPYCLLSDEFLIASQHKFRILLYPRGRFASDLDDSDDAYAGPAAAYLRYIPNEYGDEVDVSWKLRLVDTRTNTPLPIMTSGGLPRSNTTWSAAMTFCSEQEDIESIGRAADWGSSTWYATQVCNALRGTGGSSIVAEGEITIHNARTGESSFAFPPRGAIKATFQAAANANAAYDGDTADGVQRSFRVGEVIVPMSAVEESYVFHGTDYRIMTMTTKDGTPIFSTNDVPSAEQKDVRLALRPCGWKLQQQLWQSRGMKNGVMEWPVEVSVKSLLQSQTPPLSRFNLLRTFYPRLASTYQRDKTAVLLGVALALAPLPGALIGRNFVSFYAIPSASMDPTLIRGDVLLVEKFPNILERTQKGDVVLFQPPASLREIIGTSTSGSSVIGGNSLFVKRIVGMPGDKNIVMDPNTKEVTIDGIPAVGPDRNLCDDEPLRLIDRLLEKYGKGTNIKELGEDDVYVVGDCKAVSVDSRVFGVLPKQNIQGKPVGRIWPPSRVTFGPL